MNRIGLAVKGQELRRLRAAALLTQRELSEKSDVSEARIKQLESAEESRSMPNTVKALAAALGVEHSAFTTVIEEVA